MNFDGFVCEIVFNTFESFRGTVLAFMTVLSVMLVYPVRAYFAHLAAKLDCQLVSLSLASLLFGVGSSAALLPVAGRQQRLLRPFPGAHTAQPRTDRQPTNPLLRELTRRPWR